MPLALNDIIQVSVRGLLFGQRILTVLHYRVSTAAGVTSAEAQLGEFSEDFANNLGGVTVLFDMRAAVGGQYVFKEVRAQRVYPTRTVYRSTLIDVTGTHVDDATTANIAASITKQTARPGRMGVGRIQLAGIPQTMIVAGALNPDYMAGELTTLGEAIVDDAYTSPTEGWVATPCLFNPAFDGAQKWADLLTFTVNDSLRTMHRRTLRLGE